MLGPILGCRPAEAMIIHVGKSVSWLRARLLDGSRHKLVLFPEIHCKQATWANIFEFVREVYGLEVYSIVSPYQAAMSACSYMELDSGGYFQRIGDMSPMQKLAHPDFMSANKLISIHAANQASLLHARVFFHHAIGCNHKFTGTGYSPQVIEMIMK